MANSEAWAEIGEFAIRGRGEGECTCWYCKHSFSEEEGTRSYETGDFLCTFCEGDIDREADALWISGRLENLNFEAIGVDSTDDSEEGHEDERDGECYACGEPVFSWSLADGEDPEQCVACGTFQPPSE